MGSEQRNNKDHIHSSDRTHHDVRIEHMGSGDRVRNDQIGSKLASKRLTSTGPQNTGSGGAVQSKKDYRWIIFHRKELEKDIANTERPHPAKAMSIEYELIDESDPDPLEKLPARKSTRTAAKLTEGSEQRSPGGRTIQNRNTKLSLHPSCSVYQAEMYALYRAVAMVKASREKVVNILRKVQETLTLKEKKRFYWLRAHVGIKATKEHTNWAIDTMRFILNKIKETILKWQTRYSSQTGAITKTFFPDAKKAYATIRKLKPTPVQTQIFTGHTGIAEYLHRFKLLQSPSCECDADKIESVWHIILECPRYEVARYDLEHKIETKLENKNARNNGEPRKEWNSCHSQRKPSEATSRHRSMNRKRNEETPPTAPTSAPTQNPKRIPKTKLQHCARRQRKECYVAQKQQESLGYEQGVALFMDENTERLGIGFEAHGEEQRFTFARTCQPHKRQYQ
ncbi:hypothetical protein EVAR_77670_1 [Eumeta japonica]|uniref:Retrovirus-related Pol polyprotein from type-1 retrotransposable element R1 4 n=1 Tax=Eumeta variegata TaxID=151549 RepID=A0A4C2ACL7_EUMVA|nr:hypothetical protein EVAR_77670_1 [Eumeta japonica]